MAFEKGIPALKIFAPATSELDRVRPTSTTFIDALGQAARSERARTPDPEAHQTSSGVMPIDLAADDMVEIAAGVLTPNGMRVAPVLAQYSLALA
jgi:hypothetical protein